MLGLDVFVSRGLYGERPWHKIDAYKDGEGRAVVEVGSWTVEVEWRAPRWRLLPRFSAVALLGGVAGATVAKCPSFDQLSDYTVLVWVFNAIASGGLYGP